MASTPATETAASQPVYLFRGVVMVPLHLMAMAPALEYGEGALRTPEVLVLTWAVVVASLTVPWMLFGRVFRVRARAHIALGGLAAEWAGALLLALVIAVPVGAFEWSMRAIG